MTIVLISAHVVWAAPIHDAVIAGDVQKVQKIVDADKTSVNLVNEDGAVPLHLAAGRNSGEIVKLLLDNGADIKVCTKQGWTALHWAAHMNAADAASVLIAKGADVQAKSIDGKSPLQIAIAESAQAVAAILVKQTSVAYTDNAMSAASYAQAEKLREGGDLKQAYELFSRLVNDDPANEKYNFALGMTCFGLKEYSRGQFAFERVLQQNPANGRARFELARCLSMLGQDSAARKEFEKVLALNPPADFKRDIEAHLQEMLKRVKRWQLLGRIDVIAFNDSNVNVGPDSERISISPIIFGSQSIEELRVQQESQPADAKGFAWSVFGGAVYDLGDPGKWGWGSTAAYYQNKLTDRAQNESLFYQIDTGPRYLGERVYLESPLRYGHITTGGDSLVNMFGVHPACMYVYGPAGEWRFGTLTSLERRDYAALNDRDGVFVSAGEQARYYFGEQRHSVLVGIMLSHDFTKEGVYEYNGREWQFGADLKMPWETVLYGRMRYAINDYAEREVLAPADRKDTQQQFTIGISKTITAWWGVDANFQTTDNSSTFALYQYNRNVATLSMFYSF